MKALIMWDEETFWLGVLRAVPEEENAEKYFKDYITKRGGEILVNNFGLSPEEAESETAWAFANINDTLETEEHILTVYSGIDGLLAHFFVEGSPETRIALVDIPEPEKEQAGKKELDMAEPGMKACTCGCREFGAHMRCYHDVIVDPDNNYLGECAEGGTAIYEAEEPYGPYCCMNCGREYDELSDLPVYNGSGN